MAKIRTDLDFNLLDNVTRGLGRIEKGVSGLGASITKVNQAAELTGRAIGAISNAVGAINDTVNASAQLQLSLEQIAELAGASAEEQEALYKAVEDAGNNFLTTSEQAQEALRLLAEDGFRGEEAISALNTVLAFAQSNAQGAAAAAANLGAILDQFQEPAEKIQSLADGLTAISRASDTSTTNVQAGLEGLGVAAEQANISIEDSLALIGLLATKGIEGSRGTKALSTAIQDLQNPASTAGRALDELGIKGDDFLAVLERLRTDSDAAEKVLAGLGNRPRAAIRALLEEGGKSLQEFQQVVNDAAGSTVEAGKVIEDTFLFQVNRLQSAIEKLRNQAVGPILDPLANSAEQIADKLRELADTGAFEELGQKVAAFVEASTAKVLEFIGSFDTAAAAEQLDVLIGKLGELARTAKVFADGASLVAKGFDFIGTAAGENAAKLQLYIEKSANFRAIAAVADLAARQFGGGIEDSGEKAQQSGGQIDNLRRNVSRAVEEFFRITGAARDASVSIEDVEEASQPAIRSISQIEKELRAAAQAGDDYNTTRLTKELARAKQGFGETAGAAAKATEAYKKAEVALRDAIAGGNQGEIDKARQAFLEQKKLAEDNEATFKRLTETQTAGAKETTKAVQQVGQAQQQTAKVTEAAADQQTHAMAGVGAQARELANRIIALRQEFDAFGAEAAGEFEKRLDAINNRFRGTGTSMANYIATLEGAAQRLRELIKVQDDQVKNLESGLNAATLGVGAFGQSAEVTLQRLKQLEAATYDTNGQFRLLSQQRLEALRSQIQSVTSAVQEQANALDQLNRLAAAGDERELADLDYQQRLREIDELAARTGAAGAQAAAEARRAAEREHKQRLAEIRERAAADRQRYDDEDQLDQRNVDNARRRREEPSEAGRSSGSSGARPGQTQKSGDTYNITVNNAQAVGLSETQLADALTTQITKRIERQALLRR